MDRLLGDFKILISLYTQYFKHWNQTNKTPCNFAKMKVRDFKNKSALLENIIQLNLNILLEMKNKNNNFEQIFTINRIKNPQSIYEKIDRYCETKEEGLFAFKKCLNDFMGFRKIINFNKLNKKTEINNFLITIEKFNDVKVKILRKDNNYKAIHIYIYKTNECLPWELQIWDLKDVKNNDELHYKKYGRY